MNNDVEGLKKLIALPAEVERAEWQTGKRAAHGGDWWLAAVLHINRDRSAQFLQGAGNEELFETPPGLQLTSSFAGLKALPGAQMAGADQIRFVTETYSARPYFSAPLLHGKALRLAPEQILVVLWTN